MSAAYSFSGHQSGFYGICETEKTFCFFLIPHPSGEVNTVFLNLSVISSCMPLPLMHRLHKFTGFSPLKAGFLLSTWF